MNSVSYWSPHIKSLCLKLNKMYYIIKSLKEVTSLFTLRNVYFAKFQSLISYGLIFWGGVDLYIHSPIRLHGVVLN
jgi:hypothetical protein